MTLYEQFAEYTSGNDVFENDDDKESVLAVVNLYADHPELGIKQQPFIKFDTVISIFTNI